MSELKRVDDNVIPDLLTFPQLFPARPDIDLALTVGKDTETLSVRNDGLDATSTFLTKLW